MLLHWFVGSGIEVIGVYPVLGHRLIVTFLVHLGWEEYRKHYLTRKCQQPELISLNTSFFNSLRIPFQVILEDILVFWPSDFYTFMYMDSRNVFYMQVDARHYISLPWSGYWVQYLIKLVISVMILEVGPCICFTYYLPVFLELFLYWTLAVAAAETPLLPEWEKGLWNSWCWCSTYKGYHGKTLQLMFCP